MNESAGLSQADPLSGSAIAGRWSFGYDMPHELGGGFVSGELLLRSDGILLCRYGGSSYRAGQITWKYGPWKEATWWTAEANPPASRHTPEVPRIRPAQARPHTDRQAHLRPSPRLAFRRPAPVRANLPRRPSLDDQLFRWAAAEHQPWRRNRAQRNCYRRPTFDRSR
jgi:hypothetical protein